jgi:hypothetical protein
MIEELCGDDDKKWQDCLEIAKQSLQMRINLWNSISNCIDDKQDFL